MEINKYRVTIGFELAMVQGRHDTDKLVLELNQLFHDMVKAWSKDKNAIVTPTRTTLEGESNE